MLFNSLEFLIFFPVVVVLYYLVPRKLKNVLLLAASYFFYGSWKVEYLGLIVFSTLVDYLVALKMEETIVRQKRKKWLYISLLSNLGILFLFKYFNLFNDAAKLLVEALNFNYGIHSLELLLPVGISFYTFQTLAYTVDVYYNKIKAERNIINFALYVSFFPQLVAGPIERASRLLPQFKRTTDFDYDLVVSGLQQMVWGFFKKVVIADRLAPIVNQIYSSPAEMTGLQLLMGIYFFAFQIYCDFSGYSDIAIGASRVIGYDLMDNFKTPYLSKSIKEFWSRWHISLSTWFRDYLYIPLGGNRVVKWRWYYNLFIVFLVSGLWHGANWTFLVWGGLHGVYLILEIILKKFSLKEDSVSVIKNRIIGIVKTLITFHLVLLAWVFFRANNIGDAFYVLKQIFMIPLEFNFSSIKEIFVLKKYSPLEVVFNGLILVVFIKIDPIIDKFIKDLKSDSEIPYASLLFPTLVALILLLGHFKEVEFLYFQF